MKSDFIVFILLLYFAILIPCSFSDSLQNKKMPLKSLRLLNDPSDTSSDLLSDTINGTYPEARFRRSSGLSTGAIVGIVIPCVLAVVGVGVAAAFLGSSAPAAAGTAAGTAAAANPTVDISTAGFNNTEAVPNYQTNVQINQWLKDNLKLLIERNNFDLKIYMNLEK